jgi:glyoxylase-like metal-dependent hydrolase (beta-lactamase superfamily II)
MATPDGDLVERIRPGVWAIRVPLPVGPTGGTLVHLLESDRGPVLVDTGWDTPACWAALQAGIAATGHDVADVLGVAVTHFHPDHHGLSGRVREASGAWVAMHPLEAAALRRLEAVGVDEMTSIGPAFLAAGAPDGAAGDLAEAAGPWQFPALAEPDRLLEDGAALDVPGRDVRALLTPGHTAGHLSYLLARERLLCSGDHILPHISPHVGLWLAADDADPLGDYLRSLDRCADLDVDEVLPAHGHRFSGLAARTAELRAHHAERLAAIRGHLAGHGPATLWEVAAAMPWDVPWADIPTVMRHVALGEAAAHVRHLEQLGLVGRELVGADEVAVFHLIPARLT